MNSSAPTTKNLGLNSMESIGAYLLGIFAAAGFLMFTAGELSGILFSFDRSGAQPSDISGIIGGV